MIKFLLYLQYVALVNFTKFINAFIMKKVSYIALFILIISACRQPKDLVYQGIENFKLQKVGLAGTNMSIDIRMYNPNSYSLKLKKADVDVFINDTRVGKMTVDGKYTINRLDTFVLPVLLTVDMKNVLPNALQLLFNSNVNVKLTGTIKAGRHGAFLSVPINYEGKQDLLNFK